MGSRKSSRLTDYSGSRNSDGTGGTSGTDRCLNAVSCSLEEIEQCDFYVVRTAVPPVGTELTLIHDGRLFAATTGGVRIGALPTPYNYLASCMREGHSYVGVVSLSGMRPVPHVTVDFTAG